MVEIFEVSAGLRENVSRTCCWEKEVLWRGENKCLSFGLWCLSFGLCWFGHWVCLHKSLFSDMDLCI